jgi:hypothetical protein
MNPNTSRPVWSRLVTAARRVPQSRDDSAPYGFATRVAAIAFAQERATSLLDRFALRAVGLASLVALASVVFTYTHSPAPSTSATEEHASASEDAMNVLLDA